MTPRQQRIVVTLAIANILVIPILVVLAMRLSGPPPAPLPTLAAKPAQLSPPQTQDEIPTPGTAARELCQWQATQLLAQAGLGGTVALTPNGPLRFEITYPLAPGQTIDDAAQSAWTAFDVALALQAQGGEAHQNECATFTRVEVTILALRPNAHDEAHNNLIETRISASVSAADLAAFGAAELSEDEFIERVTYSTNTIREPRLP